MKFMTLLYLLDLWLPRVHVTSFGNSMSSDALMSLDGGHRFLPEVLQMTQGGVVFELLARLAGGLACSIACLMACCGDLRCCRHGDGRCGARGSLCAR